MSKNWIIGIIAALIVIGIVCGVVFGIVLPRSSQPVHREGVIGQLNNRSMEGRTRYEWRISIEAGKTVSISWEADGNVNVFVLTETQYDYFTSWGATARYEAFRSARSGTLTYRVENTDTYHLIIQNPSYFETIKVYSAEAKIFWHET
jgi:hypothetical protein